MCDSQQAHEGVLIYCGQSLFDAMLIRALNILLHGHKPSRKSERVWAKRKAYPVLYGYRLDPYKFLSSWKKVYGKPQ